MKRIYIFRGVSIFIIILIFWFSHQDGTTSLKQSNFIFQYIKDILSIFNLDVRKLAHFTIYMLLGISLSFSTKVLNKKNSLYILFFVFLYACSDEYHQSFIPGRGPSIKDVFIDTAGGLMGIFISFFISNANWMSLKK